MRYIALIVLASFILIKCSTTNESNLGNIPIMDEILKQELQIVAKAKIFFGHQSVGYNIMTGLESINNDAHQPLNLLELNGNVPLESNYFAHKKNGTNEQPLTKCDGFKNILSQPIADSLDIAMFKFCYIDINKDTDTEKLFAYYKNTIEQIKADRPNIKIVHVTVPLRLVQSGWKAALKQLLGKELGGVADNVKRNQFNQLLYAEYKGEPIYDLARVESSYPDGSRVSFEKNGQTYYAMAPEYTSDGGHLNELGSQLVAKELIHTLAGALR